MKEKKLGKVSGSEDAWKYSINIEVLLKAFVNFVFLVVRFSVFGRLELYREELPAPGGGGTVTGAAAFGRFGIKCPLADAIDNGFDVIGSDGKSSLRTAACFALKTT